VVSKVSEEVKNVNFYYVDVDKSPDLANEFGVQSIPTLILLKQGEEVDRSIGAVPEERVKEFALS
jgi:thioredoxin 1